MHDAQPSGFHQNNRIGLHLFRQCSHEKPLKGGKDWISVRFLWRLIEVFRKPYSPDSSRDEKGPFCRRHPFGAFGSFSLGQQRK